MSNGHNYITRIKIGAIRIDKYNYILNEIKSNRTIEADYNSAKASKRIEKNSISRKETEISKPIPNKETNDHSSHTKTTKTTSSVKSVNHISSTKKTKKIKNI
jgi:hypothetical protein